MPSVDADTLTDLKRKLAMRDTDSPVLEARLEYADANQTLSHYLYHFVNCDLCRHPNHAHDLVKNRCTGKVKNWETRKFEPCPCSAYTKPTRIHPHILPTQASGRWSTTEPPVANFPEEIRNVVVPDEGEFWIEWDWGGIEFRMATAYGGDKRDVDAFASGTDIHWLMAQDIFPELKGKPLTDKKDRKRHLGKVTNYTMIYGPNEYALLDAREVEQLGADRPTILRAGRVFINLHPGLMAARKRVWDGCVKTREARTFMGRRRRLFGDGHDCAKQGWSHTISGSVADLLDYCVVTIAREHPLMFLAIGRHDSATLGFPLSYWTPQQAKAALQPIVEKAWEINHTTMCFPADWNYILEDGSKAKL